MKMHDKTRVHAHQLEKDPQRIAKAWWRLSVALSSLGRCAWMGTDTDFYTLASDGNLEHRIAWRFVCPNFPFVSINTALTMSENRAP